jgi:hypothetical protein
MDVITDDHCNANKNKVVLFVNTNKILFGMTRCFPKLIHKAHYRYGKTLTKCNCGRYRIEEKVQMTIFHSINPISG